MSGRFQWEQRNRQERMLARDERVSTHIPLPPERIKCKCGLDRGFFASRGEFRKHQLVCP